MERRKFIKGLLLAPAVLKLGPLLPDPPTDNFKIFWDMALNDMCINLEIPKEIIEMEFSKGYSLSKQFYLEQISRTFEKPEWRGFSIGGI